MNGFIAIIDAIQELKEEELPRTVVGKLDEVIKILSSDTETHLCKNKALCALEELSDNSSIQAYARTQLFNILSRLEAD